LCIAAERYTVTRQRSDARDHHFGGFHQCGGNLTFAKLHFAHSIGGNNRGNPLCTKRRADLEDDFGEQPADLHLLNRTDQLIAAADVAEALARGCAGRCCSGREIAFERGLGNAVVASGGFDRSQLAGENPLLDRGITDSDGGCSAAGVSSGSDYFMP
jgi:hypothetical protein